MELKPMKVLFGALANPSRLQLLGLLKDGDKNVSELIRGTGLSQSLVSHYLKILADAGLVTSKTVGAFRVYALDQKTAVPILGHIEALASVTSGKVKAQLAEVTARYDLLVETSPFATLLFRDGRIVFANPAAVAMLGAKNKTELFGRSVMEFVPRKSYKLAQSYRKTLRRGGEMPLMSLRVKRLDGSEFDAEVEGAPISVSEGFEIQLVVRDVTEHLAMEAKLRESEARLRLIMTQTPDYVIVVDRQCQCLYINKIAKGANRSDIVGQDVANFALSDYRKAVRDAIKSVFKTGLPQQVLVQGFGRNTGVCWYDIRIGALKAHGRVEELLIISSDVTERVVSEALVRDNPDLKQRYQRLQTPSRRPAK